MYLNWPQTHPQCSSSTTKLNIVQLYLAPTTLNVSDTSESTLWVRWRLPLLGRISISELTGWHVCDHDGGCRAGNASHPDNPLWHSILSKMASSSIPPLNCHELTSSDPVTNRDYLQALQNRSLGYLLIPLRQSCIDSTEELFSKCVRYKSLIKMQRFDWGIFSFWSMGDIDYDWKQLSLSSVTVWMF